MKVFRPALATTLLVASGIAQAELSANLGVSSNYYFRGVTQTDDAAAVSGSVDYSNESGFYLGTWMSNVDFGGKEDMEVDLYAGYAGEIGSGASYDVGLLHYWYPGAGGDAVEGELDYTEVIASLGFGPLTASIGYTIDSEYKGDAGPFVQGDIYYGLAADLPVDLQGFGMSIFAGYYDFEADGDNCCGDLSYTHWGASFSRDAGDFGSFSINYEEAEEEAGDDNPNFWLGWSRDF